MVDKINRTDEEWKHQLDCEHFRIARKQGTELAFSGKYYNHKATGVYHCACCDMPLFRFEEKCDSGSGWPSYTAPANEGVVTEHSDISHGMIRVDVTCARCDAQIGHVFDDDPNPGELRYRINSAVLDFKKTR